MNYKNTEVNTIKNVATRETLILPLYIDMRKVHAVTICWQYDHSTWPQLRCCVDFIVMLTNRKGCQMSLSWYLKHSLCPFCDIIDIATLCVQTFKACNKFHKSNSIAINGEVKYIPLAQNFDGGNFWQILTLQIFDGK